MKVVCTKKNLSQGLQFASRAISSVNTLPILNNILFKTNNGQLQLSSTNLELAITTWVVGKIEEEGEITVPAKLVNEFVGSLADEKITIGTQDQNLIIEAENTQTHIKGMAAEEFPLIPQIGEKLFTKTGAETLNKAIKEVVFASAFSETQPEISGILFSFKNKSLTLAATDRYRLAESTIPLEAETQTEQHIIIPARAIIEISRLLNTGSVEIYLKEGQVCFKTATVEIISRLIDGQYPDYKQIIPSNFTTEAVLEKAKFIQVLKGASLFATDNNNVELEFNPSGGQVTVKAQSAQTGDSEIRLGAELKGQKNSILFNYRYLLDCLNNLPDEQVVLKVINSSSPAAIVPVKRADYLYIVMPIKI